MHGAEGCETTRAEALVQAAVRVELRDDHLEERRIEANDHDLASGAERDGVAAETGAKAARDDNAPAAEARIQRAIAAVLHQEVLELERGWVGDLRRVNDDLVRPDDGSHRKIRRTD